jgi:hypothetical protein
MAMRLVKMRHGQTATCSFDEAAKRRRALALELRRGLFTFSARCSYKAILFNTRSEIY